MRDKPIKVTDKYGEEFWETPVGTLVEFYYYEAPPEIGTVKVYEFDFETDFYRCVVECSDGSRLEPWDKKSIYPLSKLEQVLK